MVLLKEVSFIRDIKLAELPPSVERDPVARDSQISKFHILPPYNMFKLLIDGE